MAEQRQIEYPDPSSIWMTEWAFQVYAREGLAQHHCQITKQYLDAKYGKNDSGYRQVFAENYTEITAALTERIVEGRSEIVLAGQLKQPQYWLRRNDA